MPIKPHYFLMQCGLFNAKVKFDITNGNNHISVFWNDMGFYRTTERTGFLSNAPNIHEPIMVV